MRRSVQPIMFPRLAVALLLAVLTACRPAAPAPSPTPPPAEADLIERFYQNHGGSRVFGLSLTGRHLAGDGAMERAFENAILYENPAAAEGVSLRPLGLQAVGHVEPPAPKLDASDALYSARYGHNVVYGMYTFYTTYGGEAVFGPPLTELRIESGELVQYFENVAIAWHTGLPADHAAQLVDLGRKALTAAQAPAPASPMATAVTIPSPTPAPRPTETLLPPTATARPTPTPRPGYKTYVDRVAKFAIEYPEGWFLDSIRPGFGLILQSFPLDKYANQGAVGLEAGDTKCDLSLLPQEITLEDEINDLRKNTQVLSEQRWELEGGIPAVRFQIYSDYSGEMAWLVTQINGRTLTFLCFNNPPPFDDIARTLRPLLPGSAEAGWLAFVSDRDGNAEIYLMYVEDALQGNDGSAPINLTHNPANEGDPAWSPDGKRLAFVSDRDGNLEIYVMNVEDALGGNAGVEPARLTNNAAGDFSPAWSPDGKRLTFVSDRDGNGNWEIYLMDVEEALQGGDGSGQIRLTNHVALDAFPAWSPDGARLAFTSNRDGEEVIYLMDVEEARRESGSGGEARLTKTPANGRSPAWSPDGARLAFVSNRDGNGEIYVMNVEKALQGASAAAPANLTNNPANDWYPAWSPDGARLAFVSNRDGNGEIYVMKVDGSGQMRLTNTPADDITPLWRP